MGDPLYTLMAAAPVELAPATSASQRAIDVFIERERAVYGARFRWLLASQSVTVDVWQLVAILDPNGAAAVPFDVEKTALIGIDLEGPRGSEWPTGNGIVVPTSVERFGSLVVGTFHQVLPLSVRRGTLDLLGVTDRGESCWTHATPPDVSDGRWICDPDVIPNQLGSEAQIAALAGSERLEAAFLRPASDTEEQPRLELYHLSRGVESKETLDVRATSVAIASTFPEQLMTFVVHADHPGSEGWSGAVGLRVSATGATTRSSPASDQWWWLGGNALDVAAGALTDAFFNEHVVVVARSADAQRLYLRQWGRSGWPWP